MKKFWLLCTATVLLLVSAGWAQQTVRCESNDMHRHYCDIGPNRDVRLVHQSSKSQCIQGQTFGREGNRMWVDRGCRGDFQVIRGDERGKNGPGAGPGHDQDWNRNRNANVTTMNCSSNDGKYHTCRVNGDVQRARVSRQISGSACTEGTSWGYRRNELWVDKGCRADFEIMLR